MEIFPSFKEKLAVHSAKIIPLGLVMLFSLIGLFFTFGYVVAEMRVSLARGSLS